MTAEPQQLRLTPEQVEEALGRINGVFPSAEASPTKRRSEPWELAHIRAVTVLAAMGLAGLGASWFRASGVSEEGAQLTAVVLGISAGIITAAAYVLWLMSGFRSVRRRQQEVRIRAQTAIVDLVNARPAWQEALLRSGPSGRGSSPPVVIAPGMTRYHRSECQLMLGKQALSVVPEQAQACGVCQP